MNRYEIHHVRKHILAMAAYDKETELWLKEMLIVLECLDWKKKEKAFTCQPHWKNWLRAISESYGVNEGFLEMAVHTLVDKGLMTITKDGKGGNVLAIGEIPEEEAG